ncbi:MAG TPA: hypothetical protein VMW94_02135 [Actinomycetes bacterium]|nr:hypothetical protein [Actinomycetes bacterium]
MNALIRVSEAVAEEEASGLPLALTLGITTLAIFGLLLFLISRLDPDR